MSGQQVCLFASLVQRDCASAEWGRSRKNQQRIVAQEWVNMHRLFFLNRGLWFPRTEQLKSINCWITDREIVTYTDTDQIQTPLLPGFNLNVAEIFRE